ncbi:hypothetical protein L1987_58334 [Smallanthus sonchifolius]|uniref:Uncharacterized protein n=1 Tax=Smallanthus sonchifolius TaxID=185202 RepID=A0ACB9DG33_9ASTR|nr:hypothetical protein L1987_58334 [Smallanthus sonchifolius]
MAYAGIQMLMEKLKQLINCKGNPLINISSIIHERFTYAAEEAQYIVDLFLSGVHIRNNGLLPTSEDFKDSLNLDDVRRSLLSVKVEFMSMIIDSMKMDSSTRPERILNQSAAAQVSISRESKKLLDEFVVGHDRDAELIRDKLVEDQKKVDVVSIVADRKSNGHVKGCKIHDLLRELCMKKAREERFILQVDQPSFIDYTAKYFRSFVLLRVLDLQHTELDYFPGSMELLVHLRYLAVWNSSAGFPSSICNLWSLQTLVYTTSYFHIVLPSNISDLVNLRHLWSFTKPFFLPSIGKPMNLQTISNVELGDGVDNFHKCFPSIKELTCSIYVDEENDFKSLSYLEKLKLTGLCRRMKSNCGKNHLTFPTTLKRLTLARCYLPWSDMSIIQSLPNLEVLNLKEYAFEGSRWNTDEQEFQQLKFLRLNIKKWEAYSISFPCLKQLEISDCYHLKEIPVEIGEIPTLELIKIKNCSHSVGESIKKIEEEQHDLGNYDIKIDGKKVKNNVMVGDEAVEKPGKMFRFKKGIR